MGRCAGNTAQDNAEENVTAMATPKETALRYAILSGLAGTLGGGALAFLANKANATPEENSLGTMSPELVKIPMPARAKKKNQNLLEDNADIEKTAITNLVPSSVFSADFWKGNQAKHWSEVPWLPAALLGLPLLGGAGAYHLVNKTMQDRRKQQMDEELAEAEQGYQNALLNSYDKDKLNLHKTAISKEIGEGLDKLASLLKIAEKPSWSSAVSGAPEVNIPEQNTWLKWLHSKVVPQDLADKLRGMTAGGAGALGLLALGIPLATGYSAYKYYRNRDKTKLLNDAAEDRQLARMNENIPEPYVEIE
jgi:hypothetical protein